MSTQTGQSLTEDDKHLLDWAKQSYTTNLTLVNDILGKILTASIALLGGGVFFLNNSVILKSLIIPILLLFLLSLTISFLGVLPYQNEVDLNSPTEIEAHKKNALKSKMFKMRLSSIMFILGLLLAIGGVIHKQFCA